MNWFERYGIVGIYFVTLSIVWLGILSCFNWWTHENAQIIIVIGAGISLPIGYLLSILSQNFYYSIFPKSWQVHRTVREKIISLPDYDEKRLESYLAIVHRLNPKKDELENIMWLQDFVRKRWDVLAINTSMIFATVFAFFISIAILWMLSISFQIDWRLFLTFSFLSIITILILLWGRRLMFDQIVEVYIRLYKKFPMYLDGNEEIK